MEINPFVCYRFIWKNRPSNAILTDTYMPCSKPYALSPTLQQLLAQQCGLVQEPWPEADIARLARSVKKIADVYTEGRNPCSLFSDPALRMAYSAYYLPCNAIKLFPILSELERRSALLLKERRLRVLDLGCGPGTLLAGLLDYCLQQHERSGLTLDLTGIDRDPGNCSSARTLIEAYSAKASGAPVVAALRFLKGDIRSLDRLAAGSPHCGFDLIMAGNLINELNGHELSDLADRITARLNPAGSIIILDPGTRQSFKNLLLFRDALLNRYALHLIAPCLQAGMCPLQNSAEAWCHEKLAWSPPLQVRLIDQRTGFTKHKGIKFSYLVVSRDTQSPNLSEGSPGKENLWRVASYVIRNKGEERLYVCNGCERRLLRRLTRITGTLSSDFSHAERGDIVTFTATEPRNDFINIGPETIFKKII
jgi:ribosomal protein RSM22 (predicted rRNA methylase)